MTKIETYARKLSWMLRQQGIERTAETVTTFFVLTYMLVMPDTIAEAMATICDEPQAFRLFASDIAEDFRE